MTALSPAPQLTARAVLVGVALGAVLCLSNVYVVLKTGWSLGITLTATIAAFGFFRALRGLGAAPVPFHPLENVMVASVASSAAWMTGGGNMAALPALMLLTGQRPDDAVLVVWFALIAALGVVVAVPLKRQFIDREQLPFPMSVATAHTIRAMHGADDPRPARRLLQAGVVAALFTLWREARRPWAFPGRLALPSLAPWGVGLDASLVLLAGGSLMRPRTAGSMVLGAALAWGGLAPLAVQHGWVAGQDFKSLVQVTLWPAAALLASSALTGFALSAARSGRGVGRVLETVNAPVALAFAALAGGLVMMLWRVFAVPPWAGLASLPLVVLVGVVGARVTGETDVTPTKAMGPLTQLFFGLALPGHLAANVMGANVTAGVGLHAADLLSDLKTGWVLGADARRQVWAQLVGLVVGALAVVPAFRWLVPDVSALGSEALPAPAVMVWAGVSKVLAGGAQGLPTGAREAMALATAGGVALALLEARLGARRGGAWVPSAAAVGIAMVLPVATTLTMAAGTALGQLAARRWPSGTLTPVASGLIAGESVTGVLLGLVRTLS